MCPVNNQPSARRWDSSGELELLRASMAQGSNMAKIPYTYYSTLYFGTTDMGWGEEGLARVGCIFGGGGGEREPSLESFTFMGK